MARISDFVLHDIQQYAILAKADRIALENKLIKTMSYEQHSEARQLESRQREIERRQAEINVTLKNLYEDKCKGTLTEGLFQSFAADYAREQSDLSEQLQAVCGRLEAQQDVQEKANEFTERVQRCLEVETLTREVVMELIDTISIGEAKQVDGCRMQPIQIQYRFIGNALTNAKEDIA